MSNAMSAKNRFRTRVDAKRSPQAKAETKRRKVARELKRGGN